VKALCDVCVTSSNVYHIVETIDNDNIYFLPDKLMALNVIQYLKDKGIEKNISWYEGTCYVHEEYGPEAIDFIRTGNPNVDVLVHPECQPAVVQKADYVGSTSNMLNRVRESSGDTFFLLTECGLTGILQSEFPDKRFVGSCTMCKYMKTNSLQDVLQALENPRPDQIIELSIEVQQNALRCVERMFEYTEKASS
jgi:quinolinate synthase